MTISEAKELLRIPQLWRYFDFPGKPTLICNSPFREDRRASFSVSRDGMLFNDFATGTGGDAVDFLRMATGLSHKASCRKFIEFAGRTMTATYSRATQSAKEIYFRNRPKFLELEKGDHSSLAKLARLRNVSIESLHLASERGLLWFCNLHGLDSWIVTDEERVNAQARRMDGKGWTHLGGNPKAWTLRGSWAAWPIGVKESQSFESIALVEGGPDLLAGFHFIHCENRERNVTTVAMMGASLSIHKDALPFLANKRIRIFSHLDKAGEKAAVRWTKQLKAVGAYVDAFSFAALRTTSGALVADLNDCTSICPDEFEKKRGLWGMMP